ncbi:Uu.00g124810.m01.CDS01 [Anthostomella pinea]|uniref:Uu.00g124810.m01.CDS01 n=1 Tax=Anthostomella pinea TaxID=933095 RepID=A0AAI8YHS2_9PEZI|nr:Uu.00g124810.m01.CDS01 [Anthostomella pinea]
MALRNTSLPRTISGELPSLKEQESKEQLAELAAQSGDTLHAPRQSYREQLSSASHRSVSPNTTGSTNQETAEPEPSSYLQVKPAADSAGQASTPEVPPMNPNRNSFAESIPEDTATPTAPPPRSASRASSRTPKPRNPSYRAPTRKPVPRSDSTSELDTATMVPPSASSMRSVKPTWQEPDEAEDDSYEREDGDRDDGQYYERTTPRQTRPRRNRPVSYPPRTNYNRYSYHDDRDASPIRPQLTPQQQPFTRAPRIPDEEMAVRQPQFEMRGAYHGESAFDQQGFDAAPEFGWKDLNVEQKAEVLRLPLTAWMNSDLKHHFVASLGELIGTTMFLLFAFAGTEVANIRSQTPAQSTTGEAVGFDVNVQLYISLAFGFSLLVNAWVFFRISGGLFNPAVTLGMYLVKAIPLTRAWFLFVSQILGSLLASVIVRYLFPQNFNVRTTLGQGTTVAEGVFIEAVCTAQLVFTIFMLAKEKHRATFIAPIGIGLSLFISEMVAVQFTGGSLNPARSFGPCVVTLAFDKEHWIYWLGPVIGAVAAVVFYRFIKTLEYEMANPGQDDDIDVEELAQKDPEKLEQLRAGPNRSLSFQPRPGPGTPSVRTNTRTMSIRQGSEMGLSNHRLSFPQPSDVRAGSTASFH